MDIIKAMVFIPKPPSPRTFRHVSLTGNMQIYLFLSNLFQGGGGKGFYITATGPAPQLSCHACVYIFLIVI